MSGVLSVLAGQSSGQSAKCATVVFDPVDGDTPLTVSLSSSTPNAHIFYRIDSHSPQPPQHTGDNAGFNTNRIGSNSGSFDTGATPPGSIRYVTALAYEISHLDSDISNGEYDGPTSP
jgi:hypothetical protein